MMGFYIINKEKMDVLFCRPLKISTDETEVDAIIRLLLSFYKETEEQPTLNELQVLKFKNSKILFMSKYSFLFVLLSPPNYSTDMVSSQLFFFMKLFLNAFEITDEESTNEFLLELEGIKRREVSESLAHSFMLWNVLDLHIEDIDKRNMIEVFENILNSVWLGIRMYIVESAAEKEVTIESIIENFRNYIESNTYHLKEEFKIEEEEGFDFCEVDIQKGTTTEVKREFILLMKNIIEYLDEQFGKEGLRQIISYKLPTIMKREWERMLGLSLVQDVLTIVWR
ncbi:MAG: hypothetical protein HGN29_12790 [Asgard group archaeon]|nr:hypothetical protein [Asgard group archaeon]